MRGRVAVVVLGDVGRSPRMQYHALSLADQANLEVDLIGYQGSDPHSAVLENPHIHLHLIKPPWLAKLPRSLYLLSLPPKLLIQICTLVWVLCVATPAPDFYLLQNPPTIPTFSVVQFACWLRGAHLIIDWHNFGYTLLGITLGRAHLLVRIHEWYERRFGVWAFGHLCVSEAMREELDASWHIKATVMYDRPPEFFRPITLMERHELFLSLHQRLLYPLDHYDCCTENRPLTARQQGAPHLHPPAQTPPPSSPTSSLVGGGGPGGSLALGEEAVEWTLVSRRGLGGGKEGTVEDVRLRGSRPAVVCSSTSWTADEDFGVLLEAAAIYDRRVEEEGEEGGRYPRLIFIITGKGPQRAEYEEKIRRMRLRHVAFRTLWLSYAEYPRLLGAADLGVCLHASSSGLDLPMKIQDMFGCGLPVLAMGYSCIGELVQEGVNGYLFSSPARLADLLLDLFHRFPHPNPSLDSIRNGAMAASKARRWKDEWPNRVMPILHESPDENAEGGSLAALSRKLRK